MVPLYVGTITSDCEDYTLSQELAIHRDLPHVAGTELATICPWGCRNSFPWPWWECLESVISGRGRAVNPRPLLRGNSGRHALESPRQFMTDADIGLGGVCRGTPPFRP